MAAERETVDRLVAAHLADKVGATFSARVSGVTQVGLFVKLTETGADGFVPAATLGDEYFRYEEGTRSLVGARSGTAYRLGDAVERASSRRRRSPARCVSRLSKRRRAAGRAGGSGPRSPTPGPEREDADERHVRFPLSRPARIGRSARRSGAASSVIVRLADAAVCSAAISSSNERARSAAKI